MSGRPGRQLALDLAHRPAFGREDFLVAPCNAAAVAWIDRWPDWPAPGLALWGAPASGKSHLAAVWRARAAAACTDPAALAGQLPADIARADGAILLDGLDAALAGSGPAAGPLAEAVLHLYNHLAAGGGHLLVTGETPPARWPVALADLRSRLVALPAVGIDRPDDATLAAVLVKLFADRQLRVAEEVVAMLVARIERSFAAAAAAVDALDRAALAGGRAVTPALVREVLLEPEIPGL
ncbi:MAG: DNA replication protein [Alphaproteobacteria bacterium]